MVENINLCGYVNLKLEGKYYGFWKRYDYKKNITPMGYGMMFLSADLFLENIKRNSIRSSKFLSYFNKNMDVYFDFISRGVIVPFT